jgi:hypothetical protein
MTHFLFTQERKGRRMHSPETGKRNLLLFAGALDTAAVLRGFLDTVAHRSFVL